MLPTERSTRRHLRLELRITRALVRPKSESPVRKGDAALVADPAADHCSKNRLQFSQRKQHSNWCARANVMANAMIMRGYDDCLLNRPDNDRPTFVRCSREIAVFFGKCRAVLRPQNNHRPAFRRLLSAGFGVGPQGMANSSEATARSALCAPSNAKACSCDWVKRKRVDALITASDSNRHSETTHHSLGRNI